jgi:hypothetical protein
MGKKVGIAVMIFFMVLAVAIFIRETMFREVDIGFWQIYIGSFATVYGVFAGTDSFQKAARSKYYRPEMDDKHPEAQKAAIEKMKGGSCVE